MSTLFFATNADYKSLHAHVIHQLCNVIDQADRGLAFAPVSKIHSDAAVILRALIAHGPTLAIFHFDGSREQLKTLRATCRTVGLISLSAYLAALPQPKLVFLNYCATPAMVNHLISAGIEVVIGTRGDLPHAQVLTFTTAFYQEFLFANRTAAYAYRRAIIAAKIQPEQAEAQLIFAGAEKLRHSWLATTTTPLLRTPKTQTTRPYFSQLPALGHSLQRQAAQSRQTVSDKVRSYGAQVSRWLPLATTPPYLQRNAQGVVALVTAIFALWFFLQAIGDEPPLAPPVATLASTVVQLQNPFTITTESKEIYSLAFNPDTTSLFAAGIDNTVHRWQLPTGDLLPTIQVNTSSVHLIALDSTGSLLAYGGRDGTVGVVNLAYSLRQEFQHHIGEIVALDLSHNGRTLFTSSWDGTLMRHDLSSGDSRTLSSEPDALISALATNATDDLLAFATADQSIQIWRWATREPLYQLLGHQGRINWLDFSPNGDYLLSAGSDNLIYLWDVLNERELHRFTDFTGTVNVVRYFPDGSLIVAAGDGGMIRLWDAQSYQKVDEIEGVPVGVNALALNHDGSRLAVVGENGTIKLWDVVPQQEERE